ncbi:MAG: HAMP domain-containing histidine kinase [Bacteroidia bacterium]|nr:HAMP domain-containing histidine kinase [Bacteroidia bacterium]
MKTLLYKGSITRILFILAILCIVGVELAQRFGQANIQTRIKSAQSTLFQLDLELQEGLSRIHQLTDEEAVHNFFIETGRLKKGLSYYILENEKLVRWSNNEPVLTEDIALKLGAYEHIRLANGEFIVRSMVKGTKKVVGLLLLKHDYAYENRYLKNEFSSCLNLSPHVITATTGDLALLGPDNKVLFKLQPSPSEGNLSFGIFSYLYLFAILFFLAAFFFSIRKLLNKNPIKAILLLLLVALLRVLMIYFKYPNELYATDLFSPQNFASSFFFNSLGDLLLNSLMIACYASIFFLHRSNPDTTNNSKRVKFFFHLVMLLTIGVFIHDLFEGLVMNSLITFDVSKLSSLNGYTVLAFSCMALMLMSFVFYGLKVLRFWREDHIRFPGLIFILILCSFYTAYVVQRQNERKEQEARKLYAQKVDARRDHVAEYLFQDVEKQIVKDTAIQYAFSKQQSPSEFIQQHLYTSSFIGYLGKFDITALVYDSLGAPLEPEKNQDSLSHFIRLSQVEGSTTYSKSLYYLKDESGRLSYLGIIPIRPKGHFQDSYLVLSLTAKFFQADEGFPELFIGGVSSEKNDPGDYSVAMYKQGELVYEYGSFSYSFSPQELLNLSGGRDFITSNNFNHLLHRTDGETLVIVSRPEEGKLMLLTLFSWIFAFYCIFLASNYFLFRVLSGVPIKAMNLTRRIQVSVILLVVLSFVLIGTGTVLYIFKKYDSDQQHSISGQVNGLWFLLGSNIGFQAPLSSLPAGEKIVELNQLVRNLNIDFNIYDEQGQLFYSSQPKIFEQQIVSHRMNPEALHEIRIKGKTQYIHPERAGRLKYTAAYSPFTDRSGKVTAFLNLPYFERQNELNREISGFLSALINIYVLLLAIAVLVTLFISSRITKPLLLIQEKISGFRLGKRNEPIHYHRKDEIGQLVQEYNRMLEELTMSAERLAQSERESAWREMARQVAHEIKNPLTPMKLSVQHLQRAWKENRADKEELLEKMSRTIIEQIDTLSNIATEFSNFATMPQAKMKNVNAHAILESAVSLFRDTPNVKLTFNQREKPIYINADPDQLLRAFSNLLKNAIQAIPDSREGKILIEIEQTPDDYCTIRIADNGIGIPDNQKDKIFSPNFTTKSSGMGLGLSMVKNIVQIIGGTIWFTSQYNQGSTFFIRLPVTN